MHEMMDLDGHDLDQFIDQRSQDGSISLVSLDFDPDAKSEAELERIKWKGIQMSTLLFPSD